VAPDFETVVISLMTSIMLKDKVENISLSHTFITQRNYASWITLQHVVHIIPVAMS